MGEDEWPGLKSLVLDHISAVSSARSWASFCSFESFVLLGLYVDEVRAIRLSVSSQDSQSLIRVSRQAPFGKGNQTLVDETVRKT